MKIGIMGSGQVALTMAEKLLEKGHEVMVSSRNLDTEKDKGAMGKVQAPNQWKKDQAKKGLKAHTGSFEQSAKFGEVIFNCTAGTGSIQALTAAGKKNLAGKILIDIANPLDFSKGMPPTLAFCNTESLGEKIQNAFPEAKVVKTLNTVNAQLMVNPALVPGEHDIFMAGNDKQAKEWVKENILEKCLGWKNAIDLGDISCSRATEMYLPLWLRLWGTLQTPHFNIKIVKQ